MVMASLDGLESKNGNGLWSPSASPPKAFVGI